MQNTNLKNNILECPACASFQFGEKFIKYNCRFVECRSCGLITIFPPPPRDIKEVYSQDWFRSWGIDTGESPTIRMMKIATFNRLLGIIEKYKTNGRLLDIGCAAGYLLDAARERGWQTYGIEVSSYAAFLARNRFGENVYEGSFEEVKLPEKYFDLVVMSDVLEHFYNLASVMQKLLSVMSDNGILCIITPDTNSISAYLMSSSWNHYNPDHIFYFNKFNIRLFLRRYSFEPLLIGTAMRALNFKYIQSVLTFYPHQILTPLLKVLTSLLPEAILNINFFLRTGEMLILAHLQKE